ncbi:MAG: hypothetical protein J6S21_00500, partial [Victivallales bacterium]|nr:hypothetical protein [Victivallales bacterium]
WADEAAVKAEYGLESFRALDARPSRRYDVVILTVAHRECIEAPLEKLCRKNSVVFDIKGVLPRDVVDKRL